MYKESKNSTTDGEWSGRASKLLEDFENYFVEAIKNHSLIVANRGPKIWTFWNSMVYCSTIYTTIGKQNISGFFFQ